MKKTNNTRKALAVVAYTLSMLMTMGGIGGTLLISEMGCYTESFEEYQRTTTERLLSDDIIELQNRFSALESNGYFDENTPEQRKHALYEDFIKNYQEDRTNFFFSIYDAEDNLLLKSYDAPYEISHVETFYDHIEHETEQIMSEGEFNYFKQNHDSYDAQQIIVKRGDPAPTLSGQPEATEESVSEAVTEPETPAESVSEAIAESAPETVAEPETITEPVTESVAEPETQEMENIPVLENQIFIPITVHAEDVPLEEVPDFYSAEYSIDEQMNIAETLNLYYFYDAENDIIWVNTEDATVLFTQYFQDLINRTDLRIVKQDGWHYVIDNHYSSPRLTALNEYVMNYPEEFSSSSLTEYDTDNAEYCDIYYDVHIYTTESYVTHYITGYVKSALTAQDKYQTAQKYSALAYRYRYAIPVIGICSGIITLLCLIYLVSHAGCHAEKEKTIETIWEKIPYDLFTAALFLIGAVILLIADTFINRYGTLITISMIIFTCLSYGLILLWWLMSTAVRIRTKTILKNNLITRILKCIKHILLKGKETSDGLVQVLPFIWKAGLLVIGYVFLDIISVAGIANGDGFFLLLKILLYTVLVTGSVFTIWQMHLLQKGGQNLADGNIEDKISEKQLYGDFRKHAQNLNSLGDGMNKAVSDRLKSEMFRTELIANVSHDIRTPLTSIINYTDLLSKLELNDETAQEYIEVLSRQSTRLRKLTEDVLEASKATTGSMKVNKETMDLNVLLQQLEGEYTERFAEKQLTFISNLPEQPLMIFADGRLLWRAIDNLFNNIAKYAMPNTRVYLNAIAETYHVDVTLRNISAVQLNISSEVLMERFVRGDRSRNTEGSGLGLSIAQSLIKLQGGEMTLSVDGDLFKVSLSFPFQNPAAD